MRSYFIFGCMCKQEDVQIFVYVDSVQFFVDFFKIEFIFGIKVIVGFFVEFDDVIFLLFFFEQIRGLLIFCGVGMRILIVFVCLEIRFFILVLGYILSFGQRGLCRYCWYLFYRVENCFGLCIC